MSDGREFEVAGNLDETSLSDLQLRVCKLALVYLNYFGPQSNLYKYQYERATPLATSELKKHFTALESVVNKFKQKVFLDSELETKLVQKLDIFIKYCDRQHNICNNGWETVIWLRPLGLKSKGQSFHKQYAERFALLKMFGVHECAKLKGMGQQRM